MDNKLDIPVKSIGDKFNAYECNDIVDGINDIYNNNNVFNVTIEIPLTSGYYTPSEARLAVPVNVRKSNLTIIYQVDGSTYITEKHIGVIPTSESSWTLEANWENINAGKIFYVNQRSTYKEFYRKIRNNSEYVEIPLDLPSDGSISDFDNFRGEVRLWLAQILNEPTTTFSDGEAFDINLHYNLPLVLTWTNSNSVQRYSRLYLSIGGQYNCTAKVKDLYGKNISIQFDGSWRPSQVVINGYQDNIGIISTINPVTIDPYLLTGKNYNIAEDTYSELIVNASGSGSTVTIPQNPGWGSNKVIRLTTSSDSNSITLLNGSSSTVYQPNSSINLVYDSESDSWTITSVIPIDITDISDISVSYSLSDTSKLLSNLGFYYSLNTINLDGVTSISLGDLVFLLDRTSKSEIGVYQILSIINSGLVPYLILKSVVLNISLKIVRVSNGNNNGAWQSEYDGKNISTLIFQKLSDKADLVNGKIKTSQLPSYVDDILNLDNILGTVPSSPINDTTRYYNPTTKQVVLYSSSIWVANDPEVGKIYIDNSSNLSYRWDDISELLIRIDQVGLSTSTTAGLESPNQRLGRSRGPRQYLRDYAPAWPTVRPVG